MKYKCLDLFCGMGGWSDGFNRCGFAPLGIDIAYHGYQHEMIRQDIRTLDGHRFKGFDVIIGSPPCNDFSTASQMNKGIPGRDPPNPERGLELVHEFLRVIDEANPQLWAFENVARLKKFYHAKPIWEFYVSIMGKRCLWGNIEFPLMPDFRFPSRNMEAFITEYHCSYARASELRSRIPDPISEAVAQVCLVQLVG